MSIKNVSFVGLGVMGYPMAGHLQKNGYNVTVFNRTDSKAKKWVEEYGGQMGKTPNEASLNAEIVCSTSESVCTAVGISLSIITPLGTTG